MKNDLAFEPLPFTWPGAATRPSEAGRSGAEYVRWVQSSLNRALGLRLAVDGIAGPATRSAVRNLQQRSGLAVDGIVGPNTERALVAAGASRPPGAAATAAAAASGAAPPSLAPACTNVSRSNCHDLYFDFDKDTPSPPVATRPSRTDRDAHEAKLFEIAERVVYSWSTPQPVNSLLILGHASPEGSDDYNHDLALRRADNVTEALASRLDTLEPGAGSRIDLQVESCGEAPSGRVSVEEQRRVEVCIRPLPRWFETGGQPPTRMQPVWLGNDVRYFVDGATTFEDMVKAIRTAKAPGHFIYLLGWFLHDDFELIAGDPHSRIRKLFADASEKGVQIRAMLWDARSSCLPKVAEQVQNSAEWAHINEWLSMGAAILDSRTRSYGSHHQKLLVVKGSQGLIGFCGGADINPDRIAPVGPTRGAPFHDVHCRIAGPAAHELLKVFRERWQDHPDRARREQDCATKLRARRMDPARYCPLLGLHEPPPAWVGDMYVQIGRSYGNGAGNRFAAAGEQTAYRMIRKAIREARRFIYIEDQYLTSMDMSAELAQALRRNRDLIVIVLIPHGSITDMAAFICVVEAGEQVHFRRQQFIAPLRTAGGSRFGVFFLSPPGAPNTYVHSKMLVADDEYAIIGSANLNRRSLTHDSEVVAGICDTGPDSLAKRLRIELWSRHLAVSPALLGDAVASVKYWFAAPRGSRPSAARVADYDENASIERLHPQAVWDKLDPDGS